MSNSKELKDTAINAKKPPYAFVWMLAIIAALVCGYVATGCATILEKGIEELDRQAAKWEEKQKELPPVVKPDNPPVASEGDAIPFTSLVWLKPDGKNIVGGFNGSGAVFDRVTLSGLSCNGKSVSNKFDTDLSEWGLKHTEAGAICAVFFERNGRFEGGKFDWVSSSRTNRELKHVESYSNWTSSGIKLPWRGKVAFCVFSADGKRRSNIVVAEAK